MEDKQKDIQNEQGNVWMPMVNYGPKQPVVVVKPGDICIKEDVQKNKSNKSIFQKFHDWFEYKLMK